MRLNIFGSGRLIITFAACFCGTKAIATTAAANLGLSDGCTHSQTENDELLPRFDLNGSRNKLHMIR